MIGIVRERLDATGRASGFVLDGFPRTVAQAEALDAMMAGRDPLIVVDIVVPEAELVRRLSTRLICEDCGTNADGRQPADAALRASAAASWCSAPTTTRRWCSSGLKVYHAADRAAGRVLPRRGRRSDRSTARRRRIAWPRDLAAAIEAARQRRGARWSGAVIVCRSAAELERMRDAGRLVGEVLTELARARRAGRDDGGARRAGGEADSRRRARRRRSRGITGIRRRSARRSTKR